MRNAALVLGIIGGLIGVLIGFFSYGYTVFVDWVGNEAPNALDQVENVGLIRVVSLFAPLLAIAGGAMARSQAKAGGAMLLVSAVGMLYAFGFGVFTMFPISMCGLGGALALLATKPDAH
ncbi:DUF4064 domain-containing protein [Cochlodiniinecator piscidefendens]|uniref:DUF4064 domain-containing protein n=1 Tax=Cochlodiniinecator piscidefendens TaxID=2715756 RepID=UPI001407EBF4|nr:DUF4064 domain-containing protein [Cochlodiniinecator piscidefendens]